MSRRPGAGNSFHYSCGLAYLHVALSLRLIAESWAGGVGPHMDRAFYCTTWEEQWHARECGRVTLLRQQDDCAST